jgi:Carboxypeptidase regulatory-like domain
VRADVEWLMPVRAALVALLAAAVVACGSDDRGGSSTQRTAPATTRPPDAQVFGVVLAGPTCPVVTPEELCPPRPVDAQISALDAEGAIVATTRTDADGDYTLSLEPGDYTLVADTGAALPFCDPVTVSVPTDRSVRADISCDTGIR